MARREDIERVNELEAMFSELWQGPRFSGLRRGFRPLVDVIRTEKPAELRVVVDLAGVDPADVHLVLDERTLVVAGRRRRPHPAGRMSYYQLEIEHGPFQRRVNLPEQIDPTRAKATCAGGLITVRLPVTAAPPRLERVTIHVRTIR